MAADTSSVRRPAELIELVPRVVHDRVRRFGMTGTRMPSDGSLRSMYPLVVGAVAVAAVVAVALVMFTGGNAGQPSNVARVGPSAPAPQPVPGCVDADDGTVVTGAGPGGFTSGPDAILWFQHAYYVDRSGVRARQAVAGGADVPSAQQIQKGIGSVPWGTGHCVAITSVAAGRYDVELTELRPGRPVSKYRQVVTTAVKGGRTVITGISPG